MRRNLIGALAGFAAWASPAEAQTINQYRLWDETARSTFVAGFVNGIHVASVNIAIAEGAVDDRTPHYNRAWDPRGAVDVWRCASGWTIARFQAAFEEWVDDHQELWNEEVVRYFSSAVLDACRGPA